MAYWSMLETDEDVPRRGDWKGISLAFLLTMVASGMMPIFSFYSRFSTWGIWVVMALLIGLCSRELPLFRLFKPYLPFLLWFLCFMTWGMIVVPIPPVSLFVKAVITTLIIAFAMAITTARLRYLQVVANTLQWLVVANLVLLPVMTRYPSVASLITRALSSSGTGSEVVADRFAGLWGNPNLAGYMCLISIVLSIWARPIAAWAGRLSTLPLIYFSASRKSLLLLMLFLVLNIILVQRHNLSRLFLWTASILMALTFLLISGSAFREAETRVSTDSNIARLLDITESRTARLGGETRVDLLEEWLQAAAEEPWYGYGFGAMGGRRDTDGNVINHRLPENGSHNTYLGVYIETGLLGFITFLLVLLHYVKAYLRFRGPELVRWALLSLLACNLLFLVVSHSHLFSFEGKTAYTLFFLLPTCPVLRRYAYPA